MRKDLIVLTALVLSVVVALLLLQLDDELSPGAERFLARVDSSADSPAYRYLAGLAVAAEEDPLSVVAALPVLPGDNAYPQQLPLPEGAGFCALREEGCLATLLSATADSDALLREHAVLLQRAEHFWTFDEYRTLTTPALEEPFPPFVYLLRAGRIRLLATIHQHHQGHTRQALDSLLKQLAVIRHSMLLQDTLVGKTVLLSVFTDALTITDALLRDSGLSSAPLAPLTAAEKDLGAALAREFAMGYQLMAGLDRHPDFFHQRNEDDVAVPGWIVRLVFKPNMSVNAMVAPYERLERLALLSPDAFHRAVVAEPAPEPHTSLLRNYAGAVLLAVAGPDLDNVVRRFQDADEQVQRFNQTHAAFSLAAPQPD